MSYDSTINFNTVSPERKVGLNQNREHIRLSEKPVKDIISFSGRKTKAVAGLKAFVKKIISIPALYRESMSCSSESIHGSLDFFTQLGILFSKPIKETGVKLKLRRQRVIEEDAKLLLSGKAGGKAFVIRAKDNSLAYVTYLTKGLFTNGGKESYIAYINTMKGREQYVGLEKVLLQAICEDMINNGKLPYIKGNVLSQFAPDRTIASENIHKLLGAKPIKGLEMEGLKLVGVASKEQAIDIVKKLLKKGKFIFPETEQNAKRLLGLK